MAIKFSLDDDKQCYSDKVVHVVAKKSVFAFPHDDGLSMGYSIIYVDDSANLTFHDTNS